MAEEQKQTVNTGITLYDINRQAIRKLPDMGRPAIQRKQKELEDWFNMRLDGYAMLLSNERRDYTVFHLYQKANPNPPAVAAEECIGCLTDRGKIVAIDKNDQGNYECWIRIGEEVWFYLLFPCDDFVIEC